MSEAFEVLAKDHAEVKQMLAELQAGTRRWRWHGRRPVGQPECSRGSSATQAPVLSQWQWSRRRRRSGGRSALFGHDPLPPLIPGLRLHPGPSLA